MVHVAVPMARAFMVRALREKLVRKPVVRKKVLQKDGFQRPAHQPLAGNPQQGLYPGVDAFDRAVVTDDYEGVRGLLIVAFEYRGMRTWVP